MHPNADNLIANRFGTVVYDLDGTLIDSAKDMQVAVSRVLARGRDAASTQLADVMTPNPQKLSPEQSAIDALRLMWDGGFRHLPMVKDGKVVGVVSRGDFNGLEFGMHERERDLWEHMR